MFKQLDPLSSEAVEGQSWLSIVIKAAFIALVSFGGLAGGLAAVSPRFFFGLTEGITCPRGSEMVFEEWYDGESNQFRVSCLDPVSGETRGRTLLALGVYLGMWFLACFYVALMVLLILRAVKTGKFQPVKRKNKPY
ncbi:MAG TPA: hypothetical protein PK883_09405 [Anaerolineaceae bacterium]|nr:hypothetical protein [Anaerolineaceae bacterium]